MDVDGLPTLLRRWSVIPDGPPQVTASSTLVFGRRHGTAVVVKVATVEEERRGARLLAAWSGRGAVRVLARTDVAVLLERATGPRDLTRMSLEGRDGEAARVLAETAMRLHRLPVPDVDLVPLRIWFSDLLDRDQPDPLLSRCADVAHRLVAATPASEVVALHGDLHHGNVLDRGGEWVVIDPKALIGHRAFDFANALVNPDARAASLLPLRLPLVARTARLDEHVLRDWTLAWCGLSLVWHGDRDPSHAVAGRSMAEVLLR